MGRVKVGEGRGSRVRVRVRVKVKVGEGRGGLNPRGCCPVQGIGLIVDCYYERTSAYLKS